MTEALLRGIAILYAVSAFLSLLTLFMYASYGPSRSDLTTGQMIYHALFFAVPAVNAAVGLLLLYGFWRLKRWGRWLAIGWNSAWLIALLYGVVVARIRESPTLTVSAIVFSLVLTGLLGGIIVICSLRQVREVMR
jgi:hypothetical protein